MKLKLFSEEFVVCKTTKIPLKVHGPIWSFTQREEEFSLLCAKEMVPAETIIQETGFRALAIEGPLDFKEIGILAKISGILAEKKISIFVVSTYDTDIVLVKDKDLAEACESLKDNGYEIFEA